MKTLKLSVELALLVKMIQQDLGLNDSKFETKGINWDKFRKSCAYHGMRSLVFEANQKQFVLPDQIAKQFKRFTKQRAKQYFDNAIEIKRLYNLFSEAGIQPTLLKGTLYTTLLYQNRMLRESADIDFLFQKDDAIKGIKILLAEGYSFRKSDLIENAQNLDKDLNQLIFNSHFQELHFFKNSYNIDFHWELCKQILNYEVDLELFFQDFEIINFYGKELKVTNPTALFWSMVLHHGGKELWLKFKNLVDLIAFMRRYQSEIDWILIFKQAREFKLLKNMKTGFYLIKHVFNYPLPAMIEAEIQGFRPVKLNKIVSFWEDSKFWNTMLPWWRYQQILHYSQDEGYTLFGYIIKLYRMNSIPNPLENKRLYTFPTKWMVFNFLSKVATYGIRKIAGLVR